MPTGEIKCALCGLRKPLQEYSKNSRKLADPTCMRCTTWTETQEPDVVPAPLETGHVSIAEQRGETWTGEYLTPEDFYPDHSMMPRAPVTSIAGLSIEDEDFDPDDLYTDSPSRRPPAGNASQTPSQATSVTLPPHLRAALSQAVPSSSGAASDAGSSHSQALPPHLRSRGGPPSISTATTVREDRAERERGRRVEYVAYAPDGTQYQQYRVASTVASSTTSEVVSRTGIFPPVPSSRAGDWARTQVVPRPPRQPVGNPAPMALGERTNSGIGNQRRLGFCNSDDEDDYD